MASSAVRPEPTHRSVAPQPNGAGTRQRFVLPATPTRSGSRSIGISIMAVAVVLVGGFLWATTSHGSSENSESRELSFSEVAPAAQPAAVARADSFTAKQEYAQAYSSLTKEWFHIRDRSDSAIFAGAYLRLANAILNDFQRDSNQVTDGSIASVSAERSDSLSPSPNAKFLVGVAAFMDGQRLARIAPEHVTPEYGCLEAITAKGDFDKAAEYLPRGANAAPDAATQYEAYLAQLRPIAEARMRKFCR